MNIDNKLLNDIESYCKLNELNVDDFVNNLLKKAFMLEKYGNKPPFMIKPKKDENKEEEKLVVEQPIEEKSVEEPKENKPEISVKEKNDSVEDGFKLIEKKEKKPRKRKLS